MRNIGVYNAQRRREMIKNERNLKITERERERERERGRERGRERERDYREITQRGGAREKE